MASARPQRSGGGSSSMVPVPEGPEDTPTSEASSSPRKQRRTSSIRFSEDTMSRSPTSERRQRRSSSTDEILPIRQAEDNANRNYNTNTTTDGNNSTPEIPESPGDEHINGGIAPSSQKSEERTSWYKNFAEKYGAVSLENKGSVARDHLALERTFLAWLRTSLAFASIGIAITQLFRLNTSIASRSQQSVNRREVPFSPMMGHSIPFEVMQVLQFALESNGQSATDVPASTLLDQLLNPPMPQQPLSARGAYNATAESDEDAARKLRHVGKPLGATFLGVAVVVLFIGFHRYFEAQHWIIRGKFPASRGSVALVGFIAMALIVASLVVVVVIAPQSYQKK